MPRRALTPMPTDLVEAFRAVADKDVESVACLLLDDGFCAETMRVLAAWRQLDLRWTAPRAPCPDSGYPSSAAWRWLVAGLDVDYDEVAAVSNVSRSVARGRVATLLGNRLVLPDGSISKMARAAIQEHARGALGLTKKRKEPKVAGGDAGTN